MNLSSKRVVGITAALKYLYNKGKGKGWIIIGSMIISIIGINKLKKRITK